MGKYTLPPWRAIALLTCTLFLLAHGAHAQAPAGALRSQASNVYAGGSLNKTDYNSTDKGFLVGGDYTLHLRHFDTSLDVRYNQATGDRVGEKSFAGGIKISKAFRRYHPYAHLLIGYGVITFNSPQINFDGTLYSYDNSTIYDFGGGVDVDLTRRFSFKIDAQDQSWNLGSRGNAGSVSFNPILASAGIVYHLPYRFLRPRRY